MTTERKRPSYYIHDNGFTMPGGFPKDCFESSLDYEPEAGDIFIVTYPKCGTTWVQCILYLLLNKGVPVEPGKSINDFIPHLEEVGKDRIKDLPRPRVIKTHLPYHLTPYSAQAKYIYIARNPKDCCVSFYHHTKGFPRHYAFLDGNFDDYFEVFVKGEVDFGDYFDHILSWISRKNDQNVLFLLYEKMKENTEQNIKRIGEFLGSPFLESCSDDHIFSLVLKYSSIDAMKRTPDTWSSRRPPGVENFIRRGIVGDWRNYFSEEQIQRLDDKSKQKFRGTAAEHLWDKFDC